VSPQDSTKGSLLSRINIYTVLLGVALLALCIACLLLALELGRYNWDTKALKAPRAAWLRSVPTLASGNCSQASDNAHRMTLKLVV
jgi:hypothetical protein